MYRPNVLVARPEICKMFASRPTRRAACFVSLFVPRPHLFLQLGGEVAAIVFAYHTVYQVHHAKPGCGHANITTTFAPLTPPSGLQSATFCGS